MRRAPDWLPLCLEPDEVEEYRAGVLAGCRDCTAQFATEMRAIGRCNGIPGEVLAGIDMEETVMDEPTTVPRRVAVDVTTPCGSCAHQPICRIAPALAELGRLAVALPQLDEAVRVELSAAVGCTHYTRAKGTAATPADKPKRHISPEGRAAIAAAAQARRAREKAERERADDLAIPA